MEIEDQAFDLAATVSAACEPFVVLARQKGLPFEVEMNAQAAGRRRGDALRVGQVLGNLCANAIKFTETGSVRVRVLADAAQVAIEVVDTGVGIPPERLGEIFEKFAQADNSSTRRFGGTGLGLAICRELVTQMGGDISVDSRPGIGSIFRFALPLPRLADTLAETDHAAPEKLEEADSLRVLVADDNEVNRQIVSALLEPLGLELTLVEDGQEAVEAFAAAAFDLVLMDIQMPRLNGLDATLQIREREAREGLRRTPVLALSANVMTHQVAEYLAAGFDEVIAKPVNAERLIQAMHQALVEREAGETRAAAARA
jgi:CheY-like chemotaxis protein/anti-sigma regulatory factor (Ser/Thr protein kinase)